MDYKKGQVLTFYYNNKARLVKVYYVRSDANLLCKIGRKKFRLFNIDKIVEPELVGRLDRVWLYLRGVRF